MEEAPVKPSALRRWIREERAREHAEACMTELAKRDFFDEIKALEASDFVTVPGAGTFSNLVPEWPPLTMDSLLAAMREIERLPRVPMPMPVVDEYRFRPYWMSSAAFPPLVLMPFGLPTGEEILRDTIELAREVGEEVSGLEEWLAKCP